ncbi:hypothetical protein GPN2_14193 [Streptomyces murinus]
MCGGTAPGTAARSSAGDRAAGNSTAGAADYCGVGIDDKRMTRGNCPALTRNRQDPAGTPQPLAPTPTATAPTRRSAAETRGPA